ncbi:hypothetical protein J2Z48_000051 [Croceifilum oryzae]|uniref:Collagen-like protein n=1 Tax=Croceifilum oryzae TaxID=1553429 RepID=A0AAJ1TBV5_9BACL|nr:hypothetical protein [Croceifilum oryzae]MDQ0415893.1 hypothetical protein [Croceifilum oryzae]
MSRCRKHEPGCGPQGPQGPKGVRGPRGRRGRGRDGLDGVTGSTGATGTLANNFLYATIAGAGNTAVLPANSTVPYDTVLAQVGSNITLDPATGAVSLVGGHFYLVIYTVGPVTNNLIFNLLFNGALVQGTQTQVTNNSNAPHTASTIIEVPAGPPGLVTVSNLAATAVTRPQCGITVFMLS